MSNIGIPKALILPKQRPRLAMNPVAASSRINASTSGTPVLSETKHVVHWLLAMQPVQGEFIIEKVVLF